MKRKFFTKKAGRLALKYAVLVIAVLLLQSNGPIFASTPQQDIPSAPKTPKKTYWEILKSALYDVPEELEEAHTETYISPQKRIDFEKASMLRTKQEQKAKASQQYNDLIMIIETGQERSFDAMTFELSNAIRTKIIPILVPDRIIYNYFTRHNPYSSKALFKLEEWNIYKRGRFYLFIPKQSDKSLLDGLNLSEINDVTQIIVSTHDELMNSIKQIGITPINFTEEIQPFFITKKQHFSNYTEVLGTIKAKPWVIYITGHGSGGEKPIIASMKFNEYINFLKFISEHIQMAFLYVGTCFAGGYALDQVQKVFYEDQTKTGMIPGFPVMIGALTDNIANADFDGNYEDFFQTIHNYLNGSLTHEYFKTKNLDQNQDPISYIASKLYHPINNTPNLWIPRAGFTKAFSMQADVQPITKSLAIARSLESNIDKRVIDISDKIGLLYPEEILLPLIAGKNGSLISMNKSRVHIISELIFNDNIVDDTGMISNLFLPSSVEKTRYPTIMFLINKHKKNIDGEAVAKNIFIVIKKDSIIFAGYNMKKGVCDLVKSIIKTGEKNDSDLDDILLAAAQDGMLSEEKHTRTASINIFKNLFIKSKAFREALDMVPKGMQSYVPEIKKSAYNLYEELLKKLTELVQKKQNIMEAIDAVSACEKDDSYIQQLVLNLCMALVEQNQGFDEAARIALACMHSNNDDATKRVAINLFKKLVEKNTSFDEAIEAGLVGMKDSNAGTSQLVFSLFIELVSQGHGVDAAIEGVRTGVHSTDSHVQQTLLDLLKLLVKQGKGFGEAITVAQVFIKSANIRTQYEVLNLFKALVENGQGLAEASEASNSGVASDDASIQEISKDLQVLIQRKQAEDSDGLEGAENSESSLSSESSESSLSSVSSKSSESSQGSVSSEQSEESASPVKRLWRPRRQPTIIESTPAGQEALEASTES